VLDGPSCSDPVTLTSVRIVPAGQKPPLKLKEIWAIRIRLQISKQIRDLALFNLAIDSKLRSCDLVKIRVRDITHGAAVSSRAIVMIVGDDLDQERTLGASN